MIIPLRGKILVEILQDSKRTKSGLWISDKVNEEVPHRGLVITIGKPYIDKKNIEKKWGFQEGHIVHYKRNWDGGKEKYQILRRDMIYAIEHEDKSYAIGEYIIIKKINETGSGFIFVPSHFESEVAKEISYGEVISVGKEDKMGINAGDKIMYYKNEGLAVRIPLQEELWSLKPRAILARVQMKNS